MMLIANEVKEFTECDIVFYKCFEDLYLIVFVQVLELHSRRRIA